MILYISDIEVELIRKNIKNMHLYVLRPDGKVKISAPLWISEEKIVEFITSRLDWIKQLQSKLKSEPTCAPITYSNGDKITIFGNNYVLEIIESKKNSFSFFDGKAELYCKKDSTLEQRERIINDALRNALYEKLAPLFEKWENITKLKASSYQIKKMKTRWGTCNPNTKKIWINLELAHKNDECIEYVIMHELAHLRVANHGKDFVAIMDYFMPRWKELRKILNQKQI